MVILVLKKTIWPSRLVFKGVEFSRVGSDIKGSPCLLTGHLQDKVHVPTDAGGTGVLVPQGLEKLSLYKEMLNRQTALCTKQTSG